MTQTPTATESDLPTASNLKRFLALGYDLFILLAISMAYSAVATLFMNQALHVEAADYQPMQRGPGFLIGWVLSLALFYWFFWYRAGQTIGMKAWRIKVISRDGEKLSHLQCWLRIVVGPFSLVLLGLGYFWRFIDKDKLVLHDRVSNTRVVVTPKLEKKKTKN